MSRNLYAVPMAREDTPKYRLVAVDLRARMDSGEYPPDSQLPSKTALMERYGVALATVNRALDELRKLGLIETVHGVGTFARKPPEAGPSPEFTKIMQRLDEMDAEIRRQAERIDELAQQRLRGQ